MHRKKQSSEQIEEERNETYKAAVALKYKIHEDNAPKVAAKGRGVLARRIIEIAKEHGIPIRDDPDLVEVLLKLDLSEEIPPELYQIVAEILAFVYRMNEKWGSEE